MNEIDKDSPCLVFIPALVTLLYRAESMLGEPLTERQVLAIRDAASCVVLTYEMARAGEDARGYPDIVAEDAWNEWRRVREQFAEDP